MPETPAKLCLGEVEAAEAIGVCTRQLYRMRKAGKIGYLQLGGAGKGSKVLYPLTELRAFISRNTKTERQADHG